MNTRFILASIWAFAGGLLAQDISPLAQSQMEAIQAEKAARTPAQKKLSSQLNYLARESQGRVAVSGAPLLKARVKRQQDGRVLVDISAAPSADLKAAITDAGGTVVYESPRWKSVRAIVPPSALLGLAAREDVKGIAPGAIAKTHTVTNEADAAHQANTARTTFGVTGAGVKVGVISDSDLHSEDSVLAGELPSFTVLPGRDGRPGEGEGTAMSEIVHDLAPDADIFFASASGGKAFFADSILLLAEEGCKIIVDDISYGNEWQFQDDEIGQAINEVVANGAIYLSSSGNEGSLKKGTSTTWEGDFLDGGGASAPIPSGRVHNFGGKNYNRLLKRDSGVTLQWSDEYNSSDNDYDLYILSADGLSVVSSSTNTQDGEQEPMESVEDVHPGERIVIWKASEAAARYLRISCTGSPIEFATAGQTIGHAGTANCICVASSDATLADPAFTTASLVENSSSDGPHKMFYNPDGSPITPGDFLSSGGVTLQTPAITAGDGGATSVPGFEQFYGTSAAAPTAAGIAALVLELNPELTGAQLRTLLESSCLDIEATGYENNSGNGILMANLVLGQTPTSSAGTLALGGSFFTVNEADETISIPIVRLGGSEGEVGLTITTTNGTASESSDFTLPEGLVTLEDEVTMLDVPISIADPANQSEANETFTVSISEPTGGAILGLTTTAKVLIIDSTTDKAKPTVKITTPAANAKITEEDVATVTITGTAADKKGVSHVWVKLNSGAFVEATIPVEELGGPTVTYSLIVAPEDGLNKLEVKSEDYAGNVSSVVKRSFTVVKTRDLYVEISGAEDAGSLTSGFQGTSSRELGKSYKISAKAKAGFVFDGWTTNEFTAAEIGVTDQDLENPNLTFIMREYLELTANFIENPFVAEVVGTFNGLAAPEEGTIFGVDTVGYLSVLVSSKGSFSGSLMIDDSALKFSGVFDNGGVAHFGKTKTTALTLTRKGDKPDIELSLILDLEEDSGLITGTVVQKSEGEVVAVSDVELDRAEYSRTNPVPEEYAGNKGQRYNLLFPSAAQDNLQTNEYPQGNGIGSMFVKTDGKVTFAGLLADNTKFTASTTLSRDQKSPFFVQLYSRKGSIAVPVTLDLTQDDTDALGEDGFWFRPEITKSQYYPNGWAEGVIFNMVGSQFSVPQDLSVIPFLPPVDVTESNATLSFSSGLLDGFVDYGVNISPSNKVTEVPADSSYTLALKKTTGEISGTFTHTDGKKVPFKGTTFQKEGIYQGTSGFFLSPSSKPVNGEGESGLVELVPADL